MITPVGILPREVREYIIRQIIPTMDEIAWLSHEEGPHIFYEITFSLPPGHSCELTAQNEALKEVMQMASASFGAIYALKKEEFRFSLPSFGVEPDFTRAFLRFGVRKKDLL